MTLSRLLFSILISFALVAGLASALNAQPSSMPTVTVDPATWLEQVASGALAPDANFDQGRGLLWLTYLETGPEEEAVIPGTSQTLCNADLATASAQLQAIVAGVDAEVTEYEMEGFTCVDNVCTHPCQGEWADAHQLIFAPLDSGALTLQTVFVFSDCLLGDEWVEARDAFLAAQRAAYNASVCPPAP